MAINKKTGKPYESSAKAAAKWKKEHLKQVKLNFNIESDKDILEKLASEPTQIDYIRRLVREDLKK